MCDRGPPLWGGLRRRNTRLKAAPEARPSIEDRSGGQSPPTAVAELTGPGRGICSIVEQSPLSGPFFMTDQAELGVLRLLEDSPSRSQREVAAELGMSLGKANYLLKALLDKGFVKIQNFRNSSNKRAYAYLLTPEGVAAKADLTRKFLARKIAEYDALKLEIERLRRESEGTDA